jgi:arabinogalactan endo-1,4-beta-galactosidase
MATKIAEFRSGQSQKLKRLHRSMRSMPKASLFCIIRLAESGGRVFDAGRSQKDGLALLCAAGEGWVRSLCFPHPRKNVLNWSPAPPPP